jgi:SPOR domain
VSNVETPPPPTPVERRCPRCDAPLSAEQEWCLNCGAAVGTRIAEPRGWRASVAVVGVLLALALIAVVLAIAELSRDAEGVEEVPVNATPTPAASAVPSVTPSPPPGEEGGATPSPAPTPSVTPSATPGTGGASPSAGLTPWPEGKTAYTIVLNSSGTREDAERLAGEVAAKGVPDVGVIDSDDFESLGPDSFVVFSGVYENEAEAQQALAKIRDQAGGGSTRRIVPSK